MNRADKAEQAAVATIAKTHEKQKETVKMCKAARRSIQFAKEKLESVSQVQRVSGQRKWVRAKRAMAKNAVRIMAAGCATHLGVEALLRAADAPSLSAPPPAQHQHPNLCPPPLLSLLPLLWPSPHQWRCKCNTKKSNSACLIAGESRK